MGLLDKLFGREKTEEAYFDLLVELGQLVVASPPRSVKLTRMVGVTRAADVLQQRRAELQQIEEQMEDEEQRVQAENEAEDRERPECKRLIEINRAAIPTIEKRVAALRKSITSRQANLRYFLRAMEAQEQKIASYEEADEYEKAESEREVLKKQRLDRMRQERGLLEAQEEMEMHLQDEGRAGEGLRAKMRLEEIDENQRERSEALRATLKELDKRAVEKEGQIAETEEALAEALAEVGAEVYALRHRDRRFEEIYPELDALAAKLS